MPPNGIVGRKGVTDGTRSHQKMFETTTSNTIAAISLTDLLLIQAVLGRARMFGSVTVAKRFDLGQSCLGRGGRGWYLGHRSIVAQPTGMSWT